MEETQKIGECNVNFEKVDPNVIMNKKLCEFFSIESCNKQKKWDFCESLRMEHDAHHEKMD